MTLARKRVAVALGAALFLALVAWPFIFATTFIGDDHVFLAFARHARNPLLPFIIDQHGGEYYRPLPMAIWWLLGRADDGSAWPFAALAFTLHAAAAALVVLLLRALGRPWTVATGTGALMWLAPQNLETAYWYAASTDLFATVFVLGSLVALLRARIVLSAVLALAAYLSKEAAFVLPLLGLVVLPVPWRKRALLVAPHVAALTVVIVARTLVLGGLGASGDPAVGGTGKALQLASGVAHVFTGQAFLPEVLAFGLGTTIVGLSVLAAVRRGEARWQPFAFLVVALLPLIAANWAVGARYFYLPSVGLAWAAAEALTRIGFAARATLLLAMISLGLVGEGGARQRDVESYDRRVAAARRAVTDGVSRGYRVFHIDGGIKDLDLAVKEDRGLRAVAGELLILGDVPASFAIIPASLREKASLLVAAPPLPPSGAYRFGDVRVVGLARRGDDPSLDEVIARFPDIRFIRLRPTPGGHIIARDRTGEIRGRLDLPAPNGQD